LSWPLTLPIGLGLCFLGFATGMFLDTYFSSPKQ
jgi:hypothetical protein